MKRIALTAAVTATLCFGIVAATGVAMPGGAGKQDGRQYQLGLRDTAVFKGLSAYCKYLRGLAFAREKSNYVQCTSSETDGPHVIISRSYIRVLNKNGRIVYFIWR
jgi:hypothetical protein